MKKRPMTGAANVGSISAGLLVFRWRSDELEVLLGHPGGPFWARKDLAAWSIPKGLVEPGETLLAAALREFREETGLSVEGPFYELNTVSLASGKKIKAWTVEADLDLSGFEGHLFDLEWPHGSGRFIKVPEIDRCAYFTIEQARAKILKAQRPFIDEICGALKSSDRR